MAGFEISSFWEEILRETEKKMNNSLWDIIHSKVLPVSLENNHFTIGAAEDYIKNFIEKNASVYDMLKSTAESIYGSPLIITVISFADHTGSILPAAGSDMSSAGSSSPAGMVTPAAPIIAADNTSAPMSDMTAASIADSDTNQAESAPAGASVTSTHKLEESSDPMSTYDPPVVIKLPPQINLPVIPPSDSYQSQGNTMYVPSAADRSEDQTLAASSADSAALHTSDSHLNPNFTFSSFVVGNTNRIAHAAAKNVAEEPAQKYNPLFIYGQSGLGKTHLMHAIGNYITEYSPHLRVMCVTSENFTNIFINSLKDKENESFRKKFRNIDILLVDDIQFLQNKESTQEEFFHTFNTLYDDKKQIVLTSDTLPRDMKKMENRLRSRFEGGFVVTIEPPDLETRIAILRAIVDKEFVKNPNLMIPHEVINYIASLFDENIRTLQGAFTRLLASVSITGSQEPITIEYARSVLDDLITDKDAAHLSVSYIQDFIASYFKIKKEDLLGQKRNKQFAWPRQIAMYLCRELINESYPQISAAFGKKDHTTTLHAYDKISRQISTDKDTEKTIKDIITKINRQ